MGATVGQGGGEVMAGTRCTTNARRLSVAQTWTLMEKVRVVLSGKPVARTRGQGSRQHHGP